MNRARRDVPRCTGVGAVTKTAKVTPGSSVLVIGLGGVGLSVLQGARLADASTIIAVDRNHDKEPAARAAGAHHFVPADQDTKSTVRDLTAKRGADFAFDCAGYAAPAAYHPGTARLLGHNGTAVTERVFRHQLRPVLEEGAAAMDGIFAERPPR